MGQTYSDEAEPKPGDMIEFSRPVYKHYAIAVDKEHVVHLTSAETNGSSQYSSFVSGLKAVVKLERLSQVAGICKYQINNKYDENYKPRPLNKIVQDALSLVGQEMDYNLLKENCEHFASSLRYGIPESKQAKDVIIAGSTILGVLGTISLAGILAALISKAVEKEEPVDE
nr:HRAS-like suppressor 3 isoform X1 [Pogona vitticeps]XP_020662467.1 HRAS-like suppressor 3 isoform X1 [Pogona vitticeps]XP_020662468.1 HRAS-like suppressor 3 isoform X1 [Pogona vitticeps]